MSYIQLQFDQPQYVQFDKSCPSQLIKFVCQKMNSELIEGAIKNPTVKVSFKYVETDVWITPQNAFSISSSDNMTFNIQYSFYPQLVPKLIFNTIAASLIQRKEMLLIHGMLLNTGQVLYGQPYSGKTTLARKLKNALCDDEVLIDLDHKLAYPVPYFYFDPLSLFNTGVQMKPIQLKSIKPINSKQDLFKCATMFLYQPFADRDEVFTSKNKWCNFEEGFEDRIKTRIKELIPQ